MKQHRYLTGFDGRMSVVQDLRGKCSAIEAEMPRTPCEIDRTLIERAAFLEHRIEATEAEMLTKIDIDGDAYLAAVSELRSILDRLK